MKFAVVSVLLLAGACLVAANTQPIKQQVAGATTRAATQPGSLLAQLAAARLQRASGTIADDRRTATILSPVGATGRVPSKSGSEWGPRRLHTQGCCISPAVPECGSVEPGL